MTKSGSSSRCAEDVVESGQEAIYRDTVFEQDAKDQVKCVVRIVSNALRVQRAIGEQREIEFSVALPSWVSRI